MKLLHIIFSLILLVIFNLSTEAQTPSKQAKNKKPIAKTKTINKKSKPITQDNTPKEEKQGLFHRKQKGQVPGGYSLDRRKMKKQSPTDNPNSKTMLPKGQQKRLEAGNKKMKKNKRFKN